MKGILIINVIMDTKEYQLICCYQIFICAMASKNA